MMSIIPATGLLLGGITSRYLSNKLSAHCLITTGIFISTLSSIIFIIVFEYINIDIYTLLLPATLLMFGAALILPNASMEAVNLSKNKGSVAALVNAMALIGSGLLVYIFSYFIKINIIALPISLLIITLLMIILYFLN